MASRAALIAVAALAGCGGHASNEPVSGSPLLSTVADVSLPGAGVRFDYQDIDPVRHLLVIAHMNDHAVVIVDSNTGAVRARLTGIPTPRGVAIASDIGTIFVTSTPGHVVLIDETSLAEVARVETGTSPDGIAWDSIEKIVAVSDQGDGAVSLIPESGRGTRVQLPLGDETGNVVFDASRKHFWITVVSAAKNELVEIDPIARAVVARIDLPGCPGAHGLRIHPDGTSAFIACEDGDLLARVSLDASHAMATGPTGAGPDVLAIDADRGWLYVAAESGDVTIFDIARPGVALVGHVDPGAHAHSVAVEPTTHHVFFPLLDGPTLRIMAPSR